MNITVNLQYYKITMIYDNNKESSNSSCDDSFVICLNESNFGQPFYLNESFIYFSGPIEDYQINYANGTFLEN